MTCIHGHGMGCACPGCMDTPDCYHPSPWMCVEWDPLVTENGLLCRRCGTPELAHRFVSA